ncbi:MAG: outer membrane lipid asymmetry maintenance protein MlaD [Gammaproteobacteria bacterium]|nr:outer membrane lipid asymmetry maintenance protein MlaD [Gammaproteobacteria bacterium]
MNRGALELTVGLFVLAGIGALALLAFKVGNLSAANSGESYRISARFDNIGGLTVKAPVTLAGVRIGRVSNISIDRKYYSALVELSIEPKYDNLPVDTSASILTAGLLGAQYVGLDPGGEETFLANGDRIEITQSAVVLEHLIGQLLFNRAEGGGGS